MTVSYDPKEGDDAYLQALLQERRRATRYPKEPRSDFAVIWKTPGQEVMTEVHDESLGGFGIILEDVRCLNVGDILHVRYGEDTFEAIIRHIQADDDGRFRVGLDCQTNAGP